MAHAQKLSKTEALHILAHNRRDAECNGYERENIDNERIKDNYSLFSGSDDFVKRLEERGVKVYAAKSTKRKPPIHCISWVITAPKEIKDNPTREREFFENCVKFLQKRYGEENTVSAIVHKDETSPHLHYLFTPVVKDKKDKTKQKLCCKEVMTRQDFQSFHTDLKKYLEGKMKMKLSIVNEDGASKTNLSIQELKLNDITSQITEKEELLRQLTEQHEDIHLLDKDFKAVIDNQDKLYKAYFKDAEPQKRFGIGKKVVTVDFAPEHFEAFKANQAALRRQAELCIPLSSELYQTKQKLTKAEQDKKLAEENLAKNEEALADAEQRLDEKEQKIISLTDTLDKKSRAYDVLSKAPEVDADLILDKARKLHAFSYNLLILTAQLSRFEKRDNLETVWQKTLKLFPDMSFDYNAVMHEAHNAYINQTNGVEPLKEKALPWELPFPDNINLLQELHPDVFNQSYYQSKKDGSLLISAELLDEAEALRQDLEQINENRKDTQQEQKLDNFER